MLNRIPVLILSLAFLMQTFYQSSIVADYYVNTAAYSQNCINKAKPQLHCNGKCQMMKKLKKEAGKDQQNPERSGSSKKLDYCAHSDFGSLPSIYLEQKNFFPGFLIQFPHPLPGAVFHPPGNC